MPCWDLAPNTNFHMVLELKASSSLSSISVIAKTFAASGSSSAGILPTLALNNLVTVKLTRGYHLLWKAQLIPYLRSQRLLGFVDGSEVCPPAMIMQTGEDGATQVSNPGYILWHQKDQLILSAILSYFERGDSRASSFPLYLYTGVESP